MQRKLTQFIEQRTTREKYYLLAMLIAVISAIFYFIAPYLLAGNISELQQKVIHNQQLLQILNAEKGANLNIQLVNLVKINNEQVFIQSLQRGLLQTNTKGYLLLSRLLPDQHILLQFNGIPFDKLTNLLVYLWQHYQIKVTALHAYKTQDKGIVNTILVLTYV